MKRIGLIGGVSPESTIWYYQLLNQAAARTFGKNHSADLVIFSLKFATMRAHYDAKDWSGFIGHVVEAGHALKAAGCDLIAIGSNTTNMAANAVEAAVGLPVVHLIETLGQAMNEAGKSKPLLLGTPFVMTGHYYRPSLADGFGIECLVPTEKDMAEVDRVIFEELVNGEILDTSRQRYLDIIARGRDEGADSVILGCTEIGLLIEQWHTDVTLFDTTLLHAEAIARAAGLSV